jgi:hypothetical protein
MDPRKDTEGENFVAPSAGYMFIVLAFLVKSATWMVGLLTDGAVEPDSSLGPYTTAMNSLMTGPLINVMCLLMIVGGGCIIMFGGGGDVQRSDLPAGTSNTPRRTALPMSDAAQSVEIRLNGLLAQFHSIPENMVLPEAAVEFERIESSHVPDLQNAHREARATVTAKSTKSDELDADYAVSLTRISDALERLIEGCEELGRARLKVQGRFIEARHPKNLL